MSLDLARRIGREDPLTAADHDANLDKIEGAIAGLVEDDDPRLSDARAPLAHGHDEATPDAPGFMSAAAAAMALGHLFELPEGQGEDPYAFFSDEDLVRGRAYAVPADLDPAGAMALSLPEGAWPATVFVAGDEIDGDPPHVDLHYLLVARRDGTPRIWAAAMDDGTWPATDTPREKWRPVTIEALTWHQATRTLAVNGESVEIPIADSGSSIGDSGLSSARAGLRSARDMWRQAGGAPIVPEDFDFAAAPPFGAPSLTPHTTPIPFGAGLWRVTPEEATGVANVPGPFLHDDTFYPFALHVCRVGATSRTVYIMHGLDAGADVPMVVRTWTGSAWVENVYTRESDLDAALEPIESALADLDSIFVVGAAGFDEGEQDFTAERSRTDIYGAETLAVITNRAALLAREPSSLEPENGVVQIDATDGCVRIEVDDDMVLAVGELTHHVEYLVTLVWTDTAAVTLHESIRRPPEVPAKLRGRDGQTIVMRIQAYGDFTLAEITHGVDYVRAPLPVEDAATITLPMDEGFEFDVGPLGGNRTLAVSGLHESMAGRTGTIRVAQDGTGGRTLTAGTGVVSLAGGITLRNPGANAVTILPYRVRVVGSTITVEVE